MGFRVDGFDDATHLIARIESDGPKRVFRELYRIGEKIRDTAVLMAPYKEGWLEKAIKIDPADPSAAAARGEGGKFLQKIITVYVDPEAPGENGRKVGDYAAEVSENVTPAGELGLGKGSREKQADHPEDQVGGEFMIRAAEAVESEINFFLQMHLGGFL